MKLNPGKIFAKINAYSVTQRDGSEQGFIFAQNQSTDGSFLPNCTFYTPQYSLPARKSAVWLKKIAQ